MSTVPERFESRAVLIGAGESDEIGVVPDKSGLALAAEASGAALADAGLTLRDVDGLFTARLAPLTLAEYLGIVPVHLDGTWVGGNSFVSAVLHAAAALDAGLCTVALIAHGQSGRSARRPPLVDADGIGHGNVIDSPDPNQPHLEFELPYGFVGAAAHYALACARYMHEYGEGRTRRALGDIAMASRAWGALNPRAAGREPLTREDYLASPPIAWPLTRADCCLVSDAGGAVVLTTSERAADLDVQPVHILGGAEAMTHAMISQMPDLTVSAAAVSGPRALAGAGLGLADIDVLLTYDAFTYSVLTALEDLGYCGNGEGPDFVAATGLGPAGGLPVNTNGGGLSYTHTGMYGVFLLTEAMRQLRGRAGAAQVDGCRTALVNGYGGLLSMSSVLVLGRTPGRG